MKIRYPTSTTDLIFEFKSIDISNFEEISVDKTNAIKKLVGGTEVIDVPDAVMNYFLDTLGAKSVVMPMKKSGDYVVGDEITLKYRRANGSTFELSNEDILSVVEGSDGLLYIEIDGNVVREKD